MKRYLAALVAAVAIGLAASAGSAQALTVQRVCKNSSDTTKGGQWATAAPFYIHLSARADHYIAAHSGLQGSGQGLHITNPIHQVPCLVAGTVAYEAMLAWQYWTDDTGSVLIKLQDPGRPSLGRFSCAGLTYPTDVAGNGRTYEACTHTGKHVGTIVVQFVINALP